MNFVNKTAFAKNRKLDYNYVDWYTKGSAIKSQL